MAPKTRPEVPKLDYEPVRRILQRVRRDMNAEDARPPPDDADDGAHAWDDDTATNDDAVAADGGVHDNDRYGDLDQDVDAYWSCDACNDHVRAAGVDDKDNGVDDDEEFGGPS